jgi:hypothetical protein
MVAIVKGISVNFYKGLLSAYQSLRLFGPATNRPNQKWAKSKIIDNFIAFRSNLGIIENK